MPSSRPSKLSAIARATAIAAVVGVAMGVAGAALAADELADVQRLYRAGQTQAALTRADQFLQTRPSDPEMRFMKGVLLADERRSDEAVDVFQKLTEDHPDLVEPFNNLAALYAARGDYAKARSTLEQALRTNPSYATAHENLGDIYVAMAGQAYARAAALAPKTPGLAPKLALVRELLRPAGAASAAASGPAVR